MDALKQNELIDTVENTRTLASEVVSNTVSQMRGKSEVQIKDLLLNSFLGESAVYPAGWYDPPAGGVGVLSDAAPYERLKFATLRNPESWPKENSIYDKGKIAILYVSPVDRKTKMFGDFGLTMYEGNDEHIRKHIRTSFDAIMQVADATKVGMKFSEVYTEGQKIFKERGLQVTPWIRTHADPTGINLGHTAPGSLNEGVELGNTFEEIREAIRSKRLFTNSIESFEIPKSGCFTVEARLVSIANPELPPVFFHVIVAFKDGKKAILTNFDDIFKKLGMDYML